MRISDLAGCRRKANIVRGEGGGELLDENRSQGGEGGGDSGFHDNEISHASENMQARGGARLLQTRRARPGQGLSDGGGSERKRGA